MERRLYRALLRLLPPDMREEFGPDMEQLFHDRVLEVRARSLEHGGLWASAVADVVWQAVREWATLTGRGVVLLIEEGTRMDGWIQDLSFAVRTLLRRPGFTLAAVATLALGIGATTSMFTVVHAVLLEPLPYPDSRDLVVVWTVNTEHGTRARSVDHPDIRAWQDQMPGITLAGYAGTRPTLTNLGEAEVIYGARVTDGLLPVFGLKPALGRDILRSDDSPEATRVVVVSHRFWTERLARDPEVLGRAVTLNGEPWEVVGVAPPEFDFPEGAELWLPRRHQTEGCGHGCRIMAAVGRVAPGTTLAGAEERFRGVNAGLAEAFPKAHRDDHSELQRLVDYEVADVRTGLWVLLGAVAMVLLIACANVANLMLVRGGQRRDEIAVRAALGASRARVVRQLLTESIVLASFSGIVAVGLAFWGTEVLMSLAPDTLPRQDGVRLDVTGLAFAGLLIFVVTALFGAVPARQLSRHSLADSMGSGRRTSGRSGAGASHSLLLVGEVALSLSLLVGAGLLFRTFQEIRAVDLGFATESVERFRISAPESRYDSLSGPRFFGELEARLSRIPGAEAVGMGFGVPMSSGSISTSVSFLDRAELPPPDRPNLAVRPSSPGYLEVSGTPLVRGRWFTFDDAYGAEPVVVINKTAADLYYPDTDPIGRRVRADISWGFEDEPGRTIVGIVGDVRARSATAEPMPALYVPNAQFAAGSMYVSMRLADGVESLMPDTRSAIAAMDPELAITNVDRIEAVIDRELAPNRFYATLLAAFSLLALVLAAVGLYGVVAYIVTRRTREIGIRIALGAASEDVVGLVLRQGVRPAMAGIAVGLIVAAAGSEVLSSLLYGVTPHDPLTLVGVTSILCLVVLTATLIPARHASRIPPSSALRSE